MFIDIKRLGAVIYKLGYMGCNCSKIKLSNVISTIKKAWKESSNIQKPEKQEVKVINKRKIECV